MKRIIITDKMARLLKEGTTTLQFATDNNDIGSTLQQRTTSAAISKAGTTMGGNVTAQFTPSDGPGDATITIPNAKGGTTGAAEAVKDNSSEVQKALSSGMNVDVDVSEGKKFTKGIIEQARLAKMKKEGKVMTKKQMMESFEAENALRQKLEDLPAFTVLKAYSLLGGDRQKLAYERDMITAIIRKFDASSPDKQEEFMNALNSHN